MHIIEADKLELVCYHDTESNVKTIEELFANHNPMILDLLRKMLTIDPAKRITVEKALEHQFFADFHDPEDEPTAELLHPYDFDFELYELTAD
jgi:hypothetical protein